MKLRQGMMSFSCALLYLFFTVPCITSFALKATAGEVPEWDSGWKHHKKIVVQETAGIDRNGEPVNIEIQFWQSLKNDTAGSIPADVKREIRVVRLTDDRAFEEIPSQTYDIRYSTGGRNVKSPPDSKEFPAVFVRARVAFFADVPAYTTRRYYVFYGNPGAEAPRYNTNLRIKGQGVHYNIDNSWYSIATEEKSGQVDSITLKFATKPTLKFEWGPTHYNPDFIVAPDDFPVTGYTWYYARDFVNPDTDVESGPIFFSMKRRQLIPGQDVVYMEVYYRFYAGLPYFIMESYIEAKKSARTFAVRNDELGISGIAFTHAGWRNKTPDMMENHMGAIGTRSYNHEKALTSTLGNVLPPNLAWISMCRLDDGFAFGSIRLEWKNRNVLTGEPSPTYNSHTFIRCHENDFHYFRSLIYSPRGTAGLTTEETRNFLIEVPKGSSYYEKNAYFFYEFNREETFGPIDDMYFKLRSPLEVKVFQ